MKPKTEELTEYQKTTLIESINQIMNFNGMTREELISASSISASSLNKMLSPKFKAMPSIQTLNKLKPLSFNNEYAFLCSVLGFDSVHTDAANHRMLLAAHRCYNDKPIENMLSKLFVELGIENNIKGMLTSFLANQGVKLTGAENSIISKGTYSFYRDIGPYSFENKDVKKWVIDFVEVYNKEEFMEALSTLFQKIVLDPASSITKYSLLVTGYCTNDYLEGLDLSCFEPFITIIFSAGKDYLEFKEFFPINDLKLDKYRCFNIPELETEGYEQASKIK